MIDLKIRSEVNIVSQLYSLLFFQNYHSHKTDSYAGPALQGFLICNNDPAIEIRQIKCRSLKSRLPWASSAGSVITIIESFSMVFPEVKKFSGDKHLFLPNHRIPIVVGLFNYLISIFATGCFKVRPSACFGNVDGLFF